MNKVTKNRCDKGLQALYTPLKFLSFLLSKRWGVPIVHKMFSLSKGKKIKGINSQEKFIPSKNQGPDIRIRIFRPEIDETLPAMLFIHGGGYMVGIPEVNLDTIEEYIKKRPCVIIAPDYRKGLNQGYPAAFNDCYDTLLWMKENAASLGIRRDKFIVAGQSAGGGLTAAVTLKARDTREVNIAFQIPLYPMIDCRQNTESAKAMDEGVPVWNAKNSRLGWKTYLQYLDEKDHLQVSSKVPPKVPPYASPALSDNYKHLPPTITFVGELDPFKDETINYVKALKKENIPVKFELFQAAYHGFDLLAKGSSIKERADRFLFDAWAEYYDKYLK